MTGRLQDVEVGTERADRYADVLADAAFRRFESGLQRGAELLGGRTFWHVNSTPQGGGVAEMLHALLPYTRGAGWNTRWVVIDGDDAFFDVTKRIHNALHGVRDGATLTDGDRRAYDTVTEANARDLLEIVRPGDVALIHDPQTAGLLPALRDAGLGVAWQCHVGTDDPNDATRDAWRFLHDGVAAADRLVFTRRSYLWDGLDEGRLCLIPPTIDPFTAKNTALDETEIETILTTAEVIGGRPTRAAAFVRADGSTGEVRRTVTRVGDGPPPPADARLVVQVSRWDKLKDPRGVIQLFADTFGAASDVHLVVAGPETGEVADDPEAGEVLADCAELWGTLAPELRGRVHLLSIPMDDDEENAIIVNALQRRADVALQKSLEEGFGLVVAEAMWKGRPMVASGVGGIKDQIEDGRSGILIDDPGDLRAFGAAIASLLEDPGRAARIGRAAHRRVCDRFLGSRQLGQYTTLLEDLTQIADGRAAGVRVPA